MCPICVSLPVHKRRVRFTSLADHIAMAHDENALFDDDDEAIASSIINTTQRGEHVEVRENMRYFTSIHLCFVDFQGRL